MKLPTLFVSVLLLAAPQAPAETRVVVGSKNFAESRILGEMFCQLIEAKTELTAERKLGLAGTQVCFEALRTGAIDVYPEYTGTGLVSILGEAPNPNRAEALRQVRRAFLDQWDLHWLVPLGFNNAYELAVPKTLAQKHKLRSISDLARVAPDLTAGLGYEFTNRDDGYPGLQKTYGLQFKEVKNLQQALKYQAAGQKEVDCLDVYTTDGRLLVFDLVVLEDDRSFFPAYEAVALVRGGILKEHPELGNALSLLSGSLDEESMRELNRRVENDGESIEVVAHHALQNLGLIEGSDELVQRQSTESFWDFMWMERTKLAGLTLRHLALTAGGVLLGILVAVPTGVWLERKPALAEGVIRSFGLTQTIPSIALLAFMVPLLGVGIVPAIAALWIYSIFPILRNTYTGVRDADPQAADSAQALGMTPSQVLSQVRLPLAAPVIMAGIRTSAVISVGTATLAAFIGAGGLGEPIVAGLQMADTKTILSGALPAAALALIVDGLLAWVERRLSPPGVKPRP